MWALIHMTTIVYPEPEKRTLIAPAISRAPSASGSADDGSPRISEHARSTIPLSALSTAATTKPRHDGSVGWRHAAPRFRSLGTILFEPGAMIRELAETARPYARKGAEAPREVLPIVSHLSADDQNVGCGGGI